MLMHLTTSAKHHYTRASLYELSGFYWYFDQ